MTHSDDTFGDWPADVADRPLPNTAPDKDLDDTAVLFLRKDVTGEIDLDRQGTGAIPAFLANIASQAAPEDVGEVSSPDDVPARQEAGTAIPDFLMHPESRMVREGEAEVEDAHEPLDDMAGFDTIVDDDDYLFEDSFGADDGAEDAGYTADDEVASSDADNLWHDEAEESGFEGESVGYDETAEDAIGADDAHTWKSSTLSWDTPIDALSATGEFGVLESSKQAVDTEGRPSFDGDAFVADRVLDRGAEHGLPMVEEDDDSWPDQLLWPGEEPSDYLGDNAYGQADEPLTGDEAHGTDVAPEVFESEAPVENDTRDGVADLTEGAVTEGQEGLFAVAGAHEANVKKDRSGLMKKLRVVAIVACVLALLVGGYFIGLNHFKGRFLARTTINGLDVSGLKPQEAISLLEQETEGYVCTVSVGDYAGAFTGHDFVLDRDEARMCEMAFSMVDERLWPLRYLFAQSIVVEPGVTFDEAVLRDAVMRSVDDHNTLALPTDNAHILLDEGTGLYSLEGTTTGTAVAKEAVADAVVADVTAFHTASTPDPALCLHEATVQDLPTYAYAVVRTNLCRTNEVPILVNGEQVASLTPEQSKEWVAINDTPEIIVNIEALKDWAANVVADAVWHRDDWSNYFLDQDAFVAGLSERLKLGITDGYEAPTYEELRTEGESRTLAYERGGWNSELGRYIDVDLEAQFVRLFDDTGNVIWESACVSGDLYESRSTVTGVFEIYSKQTGTTLVGLDYNNDGMPDYESYVNYWMPFYGGYGLHDATWRSNFGGDYFYYNGSHGCINLPYKKAQELFDITFVGEKVNVHW